MELFQQVITDTDEIYIYFEVIRQMQPASILDFGMMLKRMGALSRQAMNCRISADISLEGVDIFPEIKLPIYNVIYNRIYDIGSLPEKKYELAVFLGIKGWKNLSVLQYLSMHASAVLFDADEKLYTDYFIRNCRCQALRLENRTFGLAYQGV